MINKERDSRHRRSNKKLELGSYNTELLISYLEATMQLPMFHPISDKKSVNYSTSKTIYVSDMIDAD